MSDPRMNLLPTKRGKPPVFCHNCRWFNWDSHDFGGWEYCNAPINMKHTYKYPHVEREMSPSQRNKRNKCSAWEPKLPNIFVRLLVRLTR
jgi:hypothetical protein